MQQQQQQQLVQPQWGASSSSSSSAGAAGLAPKPSIPIPAAKPQLPQMQGLAPKPMPPQMPPPAAAGGGAAAGGVVAPPRAPAMAPPGQVGLNRPAFGEVQLQRPGKDPGFYFCFIILFSVRLVLHLQGVHLQSCGVQCRSANCMNLQLVPPRAPAMSPLGQVGLNRPAFGEVQLQRPGEDPGFC
jgi:hypothetical protein